MALQRHKPKEEPWQTKTYTQDLPMVLLSPLYVFCVVHSMHPFPVPQYMLEPNARTLTAWQAYPRWDGSSQNV